MAYEKLPITNDYIFKRIFSKKGNESILKDFLIGILNIKIERIEVESEVSLDKQFEENKLGRLDILGILDDNTLVNIEIQVINEYNFVDRSLFYWSGNYYTNLKAGENYRYSKKTISINILDFEIFDDGPFHEIARLRRDYNKEVLTEKLEMHFIQIPKFIKEKRGVETKLEQWMQFISQINKEGVKLAMKKNKEIKKANEEYEYLTGDAAEKRLAFLRDKAIRDEKSMIEGAKEEGIEQGLEQGMKKGLKEGEKEGIRKKQVDVAKKLLKMDMSIDKIAEITELSKEEIEKILNK